MVGAFSIAIQLLSMFMVVSGIRDSKYHQTKVLKESPECSSKNFDVTMSELSTLSLLDCSRFCSSTEDCRRFMFEKETKLCSIFESGKNCITDGEVNGKVCFRLKSVCDDVNCIRCPVGYYGDQCQHIIQDCTDGITKSVVPLKRLMAFIQSSSSTVVVEVKCDFIYGGWLVISNRETTCLELDFNKTWKEYSTRIGDPRGNYWLGLEHLHQILRNPNRYALEVIIVYETTNQARATYLGLNISDASDNYRITIDSYVPHGTIPSGDSLTNGIYSIHGRPFSTYDRDFSNNNCPVRFNSGWWYLDDPVCSRANINGRRYNVSVPFESTWHWLDDLGPRTDISMFILRIKKE
ncbi:hypothetical protein SNE40_019231 [Patella caerulea]|uniref:Fibrinogen C-terminal domain-containing protein n=1 Tax=Patella caerulea TaxID=87958 RepID=A0AAN8P9W5_PATCE